MAVKRSELKKSFRTRLDLFRASAHDAPGICDELSVCSTQSGTQILQ